MKRFNIPKFMYFVLATVFCSGNAVGEDLYFELSLFELQNIPVEVASLFEDSKLDVASSTASILRQDWQNKGAISLGQALEGVPSVFINNVWGGNEAISIRGFATELSVRGVAHSLDGIPLGSYSYSSPTYLLPRAPLSLLSQIEMIRGPGSTLYGNDAFHGVIAMELYNKDTDSGEATLLVGDPGQYEVSAVNSLHQGQWQIHTGGSLAKDGNHDLEFSFTDAYIPNTTGQGIREQGFENASGFIKVNHGSMDGSTGEFSLTLFHNDFASNDFQGIGTQFYEKIPNSFKVESINLTGNKDVSDSDTSLSIISFAHEITLEDNLELKNHAYHWQGEQEWFFDNSQYPTSLTTLSNITLACKTSPADSTPNPLYCPHTIQQGTKENRTGFYTQLKQAKNNWNTQWVVRAGFDQIKITDGGFERINTQGITTELDTSLYVGEHRDLAHILAQARTGFFNNRLLVTYGTRWDYYGDVKNHFSPRLGLVFKNSSHWTQKWLLGHAYRAPTAIERYGSGSVKGDLNLQSETIETLEYINIFRQQKYEIEAVAFYSEWENAISLVPLTGTLNQYKNNNANASKGLELNLRTKINMTSANVQASFIDSKNKTDGIDYVAFPKWTGSLNIEHPYSAKLNLGFWQRFMLSYQLNDTDITSKEESYSRTDLYLNWQASPRINVIANIQNVFDDKNHLPSYYGSEGGILDNGRVIKASIHLKL